MLTGLGTNGSRALLDRAASTHSDLHCPRPIKLQGSAISVAVLCRGYLGGLTKPAFATRHLSKQVRHRGQVRQSSSLIPWDFGPEEKRIRELQHQDLELSGRQRQDARSGPAKMYGVPPDRACGPPLGLKLRGLNAREGFIAIRTWALQAVCRSP